eukprot:4456524-Prymnesium_polylepis.1
MGDALLVSPRMLTRRVLLKGKILTRKAPRKTLMQAMSRKFSKKFSDELGVGYRLRSPFSRTSRESRSSCESRGGRWSPFHRASSSRGEPEIPSTPPPGLSTAGCGMSFADLPANLLRESRDDDDR